MNHGASRFGLHATSARSGFRAGAIGKIASVNRTRIAALLRTWNLRDHTPKQLPNTGNSSGVNSGPARLGTRRSSSYRESPHAGRKATA